MIVLGLTGSIAMGKSTASAMLQHMGIPVHDSDAAVHNIYNRDQDFLKQMRDYFPDTYERKTRSINRKKLGEIVFSNPDSKAILESLLHPRVVQSQQAFLKKCRNMHQKIAVLDIPLLYETGAEARCDAVMVVTAPAQIQRARALSRPHMSIDKFHAILNAQMSDSEKRSRADYIIQSGLGRKHMLRNLQHVIRAVTQKTMSVNKK